MIGAIAGFVFTPLSVLLFLNAFGVTDVQRLFGLDILLVAAVGLVILQVANIVDSHVQGHNLYITYTVHILSAFPSFVYFLSLALAMPASVTGALPMIFASFMFLEGLWSLFEFT